MIPIMVLDETKNMVFDKIQIMVFTQAKKKFVTDIIFKNLCMVQSMLQQKAAPMAWCFLAMSILYPTLTYFMLGVIHYNIISRTAFCLAPLSMNIHNL